VGGALYPEWDLHNNRYRPEHCRVIDFPLLSTPDVSAARVQRDEVLRRRLARVGLGPKVIRRRPDGDDLDLEAVIDLFVDLQAGHTPPEHIYLERRKLARNLGVLILLDASGSATETDAEGLSVHDHQRGAAATLAVTLEELGDRVAVYGFRSHGRAAVHLLGLKPFGQRFGAGGRARLNQLQPAGYTRLGAGIRHAGAILKSEAGTPQPAAAGPLRRLPLRRGLRIPLRGGRRAQSAGRAPQRRRRLPLPLDRRLHHDRGAPARLRLGQLCRRPGPRRFEPPHGRALPRRPPRARRAESAQPPPGFDRMKVLVTGALGNIGSHTLGALLEEGHDVVAFDLESPRARRLAARLDPRVRVRWGDITDPASIRAALDGVDAVVHLAAILNPERAPDLARRVNVEATHDLIAQMQASGAARRLVFASSQGIFGEVQDREPPLRADTPVSPTDEYGRHKVACEEAIRRSGLQWSILRLGAAPPIRLTGYSHDPTILFDFSPDARFEFIHPADAGMAFARAVACEEAIGKILYIGGGEKCRTTHREFCNELMSAMGIGALPAEAFVQPPLRRFFGDWLDTEESQRLLQFQKRGLGEVKADMRKDLGAIVPLIRLLRPLVTWYVVRSSPHLAKNRRAGPA
jgi:nucleoside-diphosphate-sugar epimerase